MGDSLEKILVCPLEDLDEELPRVEEADEEAEGEGPSVRPRSAVNHGATGPAEKTPATDGSPDEGPLVEVKKSWLKRMFGGTSNK